MPLVTMAPTRTDTYAPTRVAEAPSYAPTTETYAPTFGGCPPLGVLAIDGETVVIGAYTRNYTQPEEAGVAFVGRIP